MLKKLTDAFGVSGFEDAVRNIVINEIRDFCDEINIDGMGNVIAVKYADNKEEKKNILLSAHMDEVGFIVTDVTEDGYLKFDSVGGIDPKILVSKRIIINGLKGIISAKAIHLQTKEEREKAIELTELCIDIGAEDRQAALRYVMPGDYAAFDSEYVETSSSIKAKALDDRVGCLIMIEMLKKTWDVNLYCTFTVQEEVGLRGARVAAKGIKPDYALVIEATTCSDMPGTPEWLRVTKSGGGAAISVLDSASRANSELVELLVQIATDNKIPYQFKAATAGGNDAGAIYALDGGIKTASISVPCRYIHSPVSVINKNDFNSCRDIVDAFLVYCGKENTSYDKQNF